MMQKNDIVVYYLGEYIYIHTITNIYDTFMTYNIYRSDKWYGKEEIIRRYYSDSLFFLNDDFAIIFENYIYKVSEYFLSNRDFKIPTRIKNISKYKENNGCK